MRKESQEVATATEEVKPVAESIAVEVDVKARNTPVVKRSTDVSPVSYSVKGDGEYVKPSKPKRYYRVTFSERDNESESQDIFMCCNGEELLIKRGVEVIIPEGFYDIAQHAVVNSFKMNKITNKREPVVYRRFPFSVFGEATEQEYRDFLAKCKADEAEAQSKGN